MKAELMVSPEICSTGVRGLLKSRAWVRGQWASTLVIQTGDVVEVRMHKGIIKLWAKQ